MYDEANFDEVEYLDVVVENVESEEQIEPNEDKIEESGDECSDGRESYIDGECDVSSDDDIENLEIKKDVDLFFVTLVKKFGKNLLDKSQTPGARSKKANSIEKIATHLAAAGYV